MAGRTNASSPPSGVTQPYYGGRKGGGYSLRESLTAQGVTSESVLRKHLAFVYSLINLVPQGVDITRYRVSRNHPNEEPKTLMG